MAQGYFVRFKVSFGERIQHLDRWKAEHFVIYSSKQKKAARQGHLGSCTWDRITASQSLWEELTCGRGCGGGGYLGFTGSQ